MALRNIMGSIGKRLQQNAVASNVQRMNGQINTPSQKSVTTASTNVPKPKGSPGAGATPQAQSNSIAKKATNSPYNSSTNYDNEKKYLQGLIDKGNSWASNQMKELDSWYSTQSKPSTSTTNKPPTISGGSSVGSSKPSGSSSSSNSPYNSNTNYNNEKKYLDNMIATGTDGQKKWASDQMGVLNNWYVTNQSGNKPYETSDKNKEMYGNDTSTHMWESGTRLDPNRTDMNIDENGLFVSNKFHMNDKGQLVQTNTKTGQTWIMGENSNTDNYASEIIKADGTVIKTGGTGNFGFHEKNGVTYRLDNELSQIKASDTKYDIYGMEGSGSKGDALAKQDEYLRSLSPEELAELKRTTTSNAERNHISSIDGTALNDRSYNYAPTAFAPNGQQANLQNMVYEFMRQNGGVESYNGKDTLSTDQMLNKIGLGGMFDINQVTEPLITELMAKMEADANGYDAEMNIDSKAIMDEFVANGGLKEGYVYDQSTGNISVDPRYVQVGDILMEKRTFYNNYGDQAGHMSDQVKHENNAGQMTETPLEAREKLAPETMTPQMKEDLQMERDIKTQLEQLTLDLSFLEELESGGGMPMVLGSGVGSGGGAGGNMMGNTNPNANLSGAFGNGGANDFQWAKSGGRGAVYGTSQNGTNADMHLLNAMAKRGGMR